MMKEQNNVMNGKAYLAFSIDTPKVGSRFVCTRVQFDPKFGKYVPFPCTTSKVTECGLLAEDVYLVKTKNTFYIVKRLGFKENNIKFAQLHEVPRVGEPMICKKLGYQNGQLVGGMQHTSMVFASEYLAGILKVKTHNSVYFCTLPMKG